MSETADRALILGASSGFGAAAARAFAAEGLCVHGVHLDRRSGAGRVAALDADLKALDVLDARAIDLGQAHADVELLVGGVQHPGDLALDRALDRCGGLASRTRAA